MRRSGRFSAKPIRQIDTHDKRAAIALARLIIGLALAHLAKAEAAVERQRRLVRRIHLKEKRGDPIAIEAMQDGHA